MPNRNVSTLITCQMNEIVSLSGFIHFAKRQQDKDNHENSAQKNRSLQQPCPSKKKLIEVSQTLRYFQFRAKLEQHHQAFILVE